ncbi:hypothetical protein CXP34_06910 [Ralstonia mannitolilytica]|nr:hypothetical protein CXP34_06910 [Ralstonia mannitolilytica]
MKRAEGSNACHGAAGSRSIEAARLPDFATELLLTASDGAPFRLLVDGQMDARTSDDKVVA